MDTVTRIKGRFLNVDDYSPHIAINVFSETNTFFNISLYLFIYSLFRCSLN